MKKATYLVLLLLVVGMVSAIPDTEYLKIENIKIGGALGNGIYNVTYSLWTAESGGTQVYSQNYPQTNISSGESFLTINGSRTSFNYSTQYYRMLLVNGTNSTRKKVGSMPSVFYANDSNMLGGFLSSNYQRLLSNCSTGSSIRAVNQDGTVACEIDTDTDTGNSTEQIQTAVNNTGVFTFPELVVANAPHTGGLLSVYNKNANTTFAIAVKAENTSYNAEYIWYNGSDFAQGIDSWGYDGTETGGLMVDSWGNTDYGILLRTREGNAVPLTITNVGTGNDITAPNMTLKSGNLVLGAATFTTHYVQVGNSTTNVKMTSATTANSLTTLGKPLEIKSSDGVTYLDTASVDNKLYIRDAAAVDHIAVVNSSPEKYNISITTANITGGGTVNYLPKFTSEGVVRDSSIKEDTSWVNVTNNITFNGFIFSGRNNPDEGDNGALRLWPKDPIYGYTQIAFFPESNASHTEGDVLINVHKLLKPTNDSHHHLSIYTTGAGINNTLKKRLNLEYGDTFADFNMLNLDGFTIYTNALTFVGQQQIGYDGVNSMNGTNWGDLHFFSNGASNTLWDFNPKGNESNVPVYLRFFRDTNTTAPSEIQIFKGDGTATSTFTISANGGEITTMGRVNTTIRTPFLVVGNSTSTIPGNGAQIEISDDGGATGTPYLNFQGSRAFIGFQGGNLILAGGTSKGIALTVNNSGTALMGTGSKYGIFIDGTITDIDDMGNVYIGANTDNAPNEKLTVVGNQNLTGQLIMNNQNITGVMAQYFLNSTGQTQGMLYVNASNCFNLKNVVSGNEIGVC